MTQLERLAKPFPDRLIHSNPSGGGSYVKHSVVTEKLLAVVGPFSFELVEVIRGDVRGIEARPDSKSARGRAGAPALHGAIVGAVCRLTAEVDGRVARIEEVGDCEDPHNWPHDGARLKDAMSDALKRCAMRLGVTLHLWSGAEFSLYDQLRAVEYAAAAPVDVLAADRAGEASSTGRASPATSPRGAATPQSAEPASPAGSAVPKHKRDALKLRCVALQADGVSIADAREEIGLPLVDSCDPAQFEVFTDLVEHLEARLESPFEPAEA